ncbi:MAG TPA: indole-3-glycerol phosphate synthase TrpC [Blastocatellia bacterium]|nr:indole-3-glycerol phosphate synthase TrpC [Blastocatellia bacterium]
MTEHHTKPPGVLAAGGVLDRIIEAKALRVREALRARPFANLIRECRESPRPHRSLKDALSGGDRVHIIAEIKRRSPSKGIIREDFHPVAIAESYAEGGAAALSVLTEEDFFGGSLDHLRAVREHVNLPLLRKDFLFCEYQLYEAAAAGADAVLLIVAALDDELLTRLVALADELGLDALVEVHTLAEMERAIRANAKIIGVNNRDLTTFTVDLETSLRLAEAAPRDAILVSESGISAGDDIRLLRAAGFQAFLIGEHFMRAERPGAALKRLLREA